MSKYDYEKFFNNVEFDFFDEPELAIYLENNKFVEETPDYIVIKIEFSLFGDVNKDNIYDWEDQFVNDTEYYDIFENLVNSTDNFKYTVKNAFKFYLDKEVVNECIDIAHEGKHGAIDLEELVKMIVTVNFESKLEDDLILVDSEYLDAFNEALGFPIPEDPSLLAGIFEYGG